MFVSCLLTGTLFSIIIIILFGLINIITLVLFFCKLSSQEVSNDMHDGAMSALSKADMRRNPCVDMRGCTQKDAIAGLCSAV